MQEYRAFTGEHSYYADQRVNRYLFVCALAASFVWHLLGIFSVRVFVAPAALPKGVYSTVSFLGAILDENSIFPRERAANAVEGKEAGYPPSLDISHLFAKEGLRAYIEGPVVKDNFNMLEESELKLAEKGGFTGAKQIPTKSSDRVRVSYRAYPMGIKGPVKFREVVYKPAPPSYLRWDEELGVGLDRLGDSFEMELKFWVSADGKVELVERVSSSGHPTVDLIGIRYLKGWRFVPLAGSESKEAQWGVIKLNFNLSDMSAESRGGRQDFKDARLKW